MTAERQRSYAIHPETERQIRLYYFTVLEVAEMLKCSVDYVRAKLHGKMIWYEGRWMISPSDIQQMRKLA